MTVTSRVPALLDHLFALFSGDPTLGTAPAPGTVTVYDGPPTTLLDAPLKLYVGLSDPDNTGGEAAADLTPSWAAIRRPGRNEHGTIPSSAEAWPPTPDLRSIRVAPYAIVPPLQTLP